MIEYHYDGGSVAPIHLEDNTWNPEHRLVREVVCSPYRNREGPLSTIALGDIDAPERLRPIASWFQVAYGSCFLFRRVPDNLVHTGCFLALVFRHPSHGKGFTAKRVG